MITAQELLQAGWIGKDIGRILKDSKSWSDEDTENFRKTNKTPIKKSSDLALRYGSVLWWFITNPCVCELGGSSNSQKRRWLNEGAVHINGSSVKPDDDFPDTLISLVFFPKSNFKITMI